MVHGFTTQIIIHTGECAGKHSEKKHGRIIRRITGLDPAKPNFDIGEGLGYQLNETCAETVDIYHTDSSSMGVIGNVAGHMNFFLNGGAKQPGCGNSIKGLTPKYPISGGN